MSALAKAKELRAHECGCGGPCGQRTPACISEAALSERTRALEEGLGAAIRAAKLALFVIRKQGVMPNSSWERGFNADLAKAEAAEAALSERTRVLTDALSGLADAVTAEVNEKGAGGYLLARLSDARDALAALSAPNQGGQDA